MTDYIYYRIAATHKPSDHVVAVTFIMLDITIKENTMRALYCGCSLIFTLMFSFVSGCQHTQRAAPQGTVVDLLAGNTYQCRYTPEPITLDGVLDEPAWRESQRIERFQLFRPAGSYLLTTTGMLTWDDEYLYIAFECTDDDIRSASTQHDDYLAAGDVVELYIKYNDNFPQYYELVCAPNGTTFDARWPHRGAGNFRQWTPWESGMQAVSVVHGTPDQSNDVDQGFTIEIAIPWLYFDGIKTPPTPGTNWTFGLFRYDHSARLSEAHLTMSLSDSPEHGFHYYEAYHTIVFTPSSRGH